MANVIETYGDPTKLGAVATLAYTKTERYHTVTLETPDAPPVKYQLTMLDNVRGRFAALRAELTAAGYEKLTAA